MLLTIATSIQAYANESQFYPIGGKNLSYTSASGESLLTIAEKNHMAAEHLMWANGIKNIYISSGTPLLIPARRIVPNRPNQQQPYIVINIPEYMVYIFGNQGNINYYPVAAGAVKTPTPICTTKIIEKIKDPTWIPPEWAGGGEPVPPGADNPLGDRWIGLDIPGYGIHSTTNPSSIGLSASHGCLRMRPANARSFFELAKVGMTVNIIYEPILIGQDPSTKIIYMSVFPDTYSKIEDYYSHAMSKLAYYGIEGIADNDSVKSAIANKRGVPIPILGTETRITINGVPAEMELPPVSRKGKLYVTDAFFNQIGIYREFDGETITFSKGNKQCAYRVFPDFSWNGEYLIPLREVLEKLDMQTEFTDKEIRITFKDED